MLAPPCHGGRARRLAGTPPRTSLCGRADQKEGSRVDHWEYLPFKAGEWQPPFGMLLVAYPPSRYRPVRINAFVDYLRAEIPKSGAGS
jgi:DNA-binding transcriptional LysR family regulator